MVMAFISRDPVTDNVLVVRGADLVLTHEGLLWVFWNLHRLLLKKTKDYKTLTENDILPRTCFEIVSNSDLIWA